MYMKRCNRCFEFSFKENLQENWYCPACFTNLSHVKAIHIKPGNVPPFVETETMEHKKQEENMTSFQR